MKREKKWIKKIAAVLIGVLLFSVVYGVFPFQKVFSVKTQFIVQPLPSMKQTSDYGTYFIAIPHYGIDITGIDENKGMYIKMPVDGKVTRVNNTCPVGSLGDFCGFGYGNTIELESENFVLLFGHLEKDTVQVKEGDYVKAGEQLAQVGSSGNSTGPHLHYEVRHKPGIIIWQTINPENITYKLRYEEKMSN